MGGLIVLKIFGKNGIKPNFQHHLSWKIPFEKRSTHYTVQLFICFDLNSTSVKEFIAKTFDTKLIMNYLPTVENLALRHSDKYTDFTCCSCNETMETYAHLWLCSKYSDSVSWIVDNVTIFTLDHFGIYNHSFKQQLVPSHQLWQHFLISSGFS